MCVLSSWRIKMTINAILNVFAFCKLLAYSNILKWSRHAWDSGCCTVQKQSVRLGRWSTGFCDAVVTNGAARWPWCERALTRWAWQLDNGRHQCRRWLQARLCMSPGKSAVGRHTGVPNVFISDRFEVGIPLRALTNWRAVRHEGTSPLVWRWQIVLGVLNGYITDWGRTAKASLRRLVGRVNYYCKRLQIIPKACVITWQLGWRDWLSSFPILSTLRRRSQKILRPITCPWRHHFRRRRRRQQHQQPVPCRRWRTSTLRLSTKMVPDRVHISRTASDTSSCSISRR